MKQDMILILDLGSEENVMIAREIRALGVYTEIHPHDITLEELKKLPSVKGIILNGGKNRIVDGVAIDVRDEIYSCGIPMIAVDHNTNGKCPSVPSLGDCPHCRANALAEFVFEKCGCEKNWNMDNFISDQIELIRKQVGDGKVLLALSGGVDSSVVAALLIKAIGKNLTCVHVHKN